MEIALAHARQELKKCYSVVEDYVKRMKNRERLKLPVATLTVPGHGEIHMGRRKFRPQHQERSQAEESFMKLWGDAGRRGASAAVDAPLCEGYLRGSVFRFYPFEGWF